jgi:hypothetical protein
VRALPEENDLGFRFCNRRCVRIPIISSAREDDPFLGRVAHASILNVQQRHLHAHRLSGQVKSGQRISLESGVLLTLLVVLKQGLLPFSGEGKFSGWICE